MKPWIHAESTATRFGGSPEDYIEIHDLLDSSKGALADSRHRALTHTSWFLSVILERIFGTTITNSKGRVLSVREIGEQHVLEDFRGRYIPTPQDYLTNLQLQPWMINGGGDPPPSFHKLRRDKMSVMEKYLEAKRRADEAMETCQATMKDAFTEGAKAVFEAHPIVESFSWRQYTPYFNDGEECIFSANVDYPIITFSTDEKDEDRDDWDERYYDKVDKTDEAEAWRSIKSFLRQFDRELFRFSFGDHVRVTVTKDGLTETEHLEHD